ncbi:MAG: sulfotransferase family 2 domain-containing protein [Pseudomonadota bacterium]
MIYSPARRFVFVHIPKTGGTALATVLEEEADRDDWLIGDTPAAKAARRTLPHAVRQIGKHGRLADLVQLIGPKALDGAFVFTLVRNPWDRMVSYYHWARDQSFKHPAVALARARTFEGFVTAPQTLASFAANPADAQVRLPDGSLRCDAFVRLERFDDDIQPLAAHLGCPIALPKMRINASSRNSDWRSYYSSASADLVARACSADVARFGYRFN